MTTDDRSDSATMVRVGDADAFADGDRRVVEHEGREIAVFYTNGDFHAISNICVHQGGPMCDGMLSGTVTADDEGELCYDRDGEIVSCPWHGWEFDVTTGEHLANTDYRLPRYDVVVEDETVYLAV